MDGYNDAKEGAQIMARINFIELPAADIGARNPFMRRPLAGR